MSQTIDNDLQKTISILTNDLDKLYQVVHHHHLVLDELRKEHVRHVLLIEFLAEKIGVGAEEFTTWSETRWNEIQEETKAAAEKQKAEAINTLTTPIKLD